MQSVIAIKKGFVNPAKYLLITLRKTQKAFDNLLLQELRCSLPLCGDSQVILLRVATRAIFSYINQFCRKKREERKSKATNEIETMLR